MRIRAAFTVLAIGLTLGAVACDGSVKWPGFETPEPPPTNMPAPPTSGPNTIPTDAEPTTPVTAPPSTPVVPPLPVSPHEADTDTGTDAATGDTSTEDTTDAPTETGETPDTAEPDTTDNVPLDTSGDTQVTPPETAPEPDPTPAPVIPPAFSYHAPGNLQAGSGTGSPDRTVFAPDMVFPILAAAAYPQSMVWRFGGGIGGGDECDARNYAYPWQDNFCEKRTRQNGTPSCPVDRVHLGQDIRVGDAAGCNAMRREYRDNARGITRYRVVAAEDGIISNIGRYTVTLRSGPRIYRYLHMNMLALQVSLGDTISAGQHLGYVSKDFGGTPTTFHLHFEIKVNTPDGGWEFVPPYTSLVESYARREQAPGEEIPRTVGVASAGIPIPEGFIITE